MHDEKMIIYGDGACPLCVQLGRFCERLGSAHVEFLTWQDHHPARHDQQPPESLAVRIGDHEWQGREAWEQILSHHPRLKSLGWLAHRLGLAATAGLTLERVGSAARRLCWRCPRP